MDEVASSCPKGLVGDFKEYGYKRKQEAFYPKTSSLSPGEAYL